MSKKLYKILFVFLCLFLMINNVNAKSLKQLKDELAKDEANKAALIARQKTVQSKISKMNNEIADINKKIIENRNKIQESKEKIQELQKDIEDKQKEIDNLLSFMQISNKDNIYLEYVFEAKTFTDFIYRSAIVEQLTQYNDELIDYMYKIIEENKQLQKDLNKRIQESEDDIDSLEVSLKKYNLTMNDLAEEQVDIEADIKARKVEVAAYEKIYKENKCDENIDVSKCTNVPPADKLVRPLTKGTITSLFGYRYHPTQHVWKLHSGVDIGGNKTGTNVYAAATGRVSKIVNKSSCGGNMVYIEHKIKGKNLRTVYMHLHTIKVKVNDIVTYSTVIGTVGGGESYDRCSTGPHLHLSVINSWTGGSYQEPYNYFDLPKLGGRFTSRW